MMEFEWDEAKNLANIRQHGFDFADAWRVFNGPVLARADLREEYGEERWLAIGLLEDNVVALAFTLRGKVRIRIISFRKADRDEREELEKTIQD